MRKQYVGIPIVLWICAAAWFHTMIGGGGYELAVLHDDANFLDSFSARVRDRVRESEQTVEFDVGDESPSAAPADEEAPPPEVVKPPKKDQEKPNDPAKPVERPKEPKKEDEKKVAIPVQPAPPPPQPQKDQRIAVKQHVRPDQEDNKSAQFIADEANKVDEEKVATQTSHDEDDEKPAPGGNHAGPNDEVGNAEKTKVANSEEHPGEKNRAPGEKGTTLEIEKPAPVKAAAKQPIASAKPAPAGGDGRTAATPAKAPKVEEPTPAPPSGADVPDSPQGSWSFNPFSGNPKTGAANDKSAQGKTGRKEDAPDRPSTTKWLGLGGTPGPGQINLNLNHQAVIATVGEDKLRKERSADGERRLTAHRGSWRSSNFDRWRSAIENYVTSVKAGNQTALNAARVPFATYLNGIHNRIHPIFAESFLDSLSGLPEGHPLNNKKMHTNLEIVLTKDGKIVKMGITRTSGVTAFDIAALDAVERASPFGPAPGAILSTDGNVYLHWEFHRDEVFACSTMNARPFMLNVPSKGEQPEMPPAGPKPTEGAAPAGSRHGLRRSFGRTY